MVTPGEKVVRTDELEQPELLWGLRGRGGNLALLTRWDFRLHRLGPEVLVTFVADPGDERKRCYEAYREWTRTAPWEASTLATCITLPDDPEVSVPEVPVSESRGQPAIALLGAWTGELTVGEPTIRSLRAAGTPLFDSSSSMPWLEAQSLLDESFPDGLLYDWEGQAVSQEVLSDGGSTTSSSTQTPQPCR